MPDFYTDPFELRTRMQEIIDSGRWPEQEPCLRADLAEYDAILARADEQMRNG